MAVNLIWVTPDSDKLVGYMARVSNPKATLEDSTEKLISYLLTHKHYSPFEMVSACVSIETTRDIARQILRHRSFHFQEFSQRYSEVEAEPIFREVRLQDAKNRQNSIQTNDTDLSKHWEGCQRIAYRAAHSAYQEALKCGIAKEVARAVLPEGMTPTKMYMQGTLRDWLFYLSIRMGPETQYEHRVVAREILAVLQSSCSSIFQAARTAGLIEPLEDV